MMIDELCISRKDSLSYKDLAITARFDAASCERVGTYNRGRALHASVREMMLAMFLKHQGRILCQQPIFILSAYT